MSVIRCSSGHEWRNDPNTAALRDGWADCQQLWIAESQKAARLAEQLRGAVEALRWALGFIEYQGEPSPLNDPREGETDAESYRRAQAFVGGS